ncbi:BTB/POZ and MATH domain-containing protein 2-like [Triticum dicoccoides]|uniref:BTB/POZ and MATH domain-containing protein 2-like n=1 Tax=Triticum dicoccoides TaxID=85692 RepID=UPI001891226B|nr:BTB/POZ and MATH domain-containing protein 2-like [Triticum dicoccoides]
MSFVGVSVIANGELLGADTSPASCPSASGYHLLVVQGHSRMREKSNISHRFTVGGHRWRIVYNPALYDLGEDGVVVLCLFLDEKLDTTAEPVKAQVEFSFVDETDKQEPARIRASKILELRGQCNDAFKYIDRAVLDKHLNNGSFTIRCDIVVLNPTCDTAFITVPPSDMQQNFTDFLLAGEGTDVVFHVGCETFAAHRCILTARSTVFRAALFGPMKEGTSTAATVHIDDMDATVFKGMLGFIYSDSFPAMDTNENEGALLQHLLIAADRYNLPRLRAMCEKKLCEHIDVSTVTTILGLAEPHGCDGLKKVCCKFLRCPDNLRAVVSMDGFDDLCRSCPTLMKGMILGVLPAK